MEWIHQLWGWLNKGGHATVLSALGALVGLIISLGLSWQEKRRSRFALGVDVLLKQEDRFNNGDDMVRARVLAADALIRHTHNDSVDDVLDFFETVAILTRKGALDEDLVWHTFFHWIDGYYQATQQYIQTEQHRWKATWNDFVWLHERMRKIEKRKGEHADEDLIMSDHEVSEFLESEKSIKN